MCPNLVTCEARRRPGRRGGLRRPRRRPWGEAQAPLEGASGVGGSAPGALVSGSRASGSQAKPSPTSVSSAQAWAKPRIPPPLSSIVFSALLLSPSFGLRFATAWTSPSGRPGGDVFAPGASCGGGASPLRHTHTTRCLCLPRRGPVVHPSAPCEVTVGVGVIRLEPGPPPVCHFSCGELASSGCSLRPHHPQDRLGSRRHAHDDQVVEEELRALALEGGERCGSYT